MRAIVKRLMLIAALFASGAAYAYQPDDPYLAYAERMAGRWAPQDQEVDAKRAVSAERFGDDPVHPWSSGGPWLRSTARAASIAPPRPTTRVLLLQYARRIRFAPKFTRTRCPCDRRIAERRAGRARRSDELWPIDRLRRPYERNPRTHSDAQVGQIFASMVELGGRTRCWSTSRAAY